MNTQNSNPKLNPVKFTKSTHSKDELCTCIPKYLVIKFSAGEKLIMKSNLLGCRVSNELLFEYSMITGIRKVILYSSPLFRALLINE